MDECGAVTVHGSRNYLHRPVRSAACSSMSVDVAAREIGRTAAAVMTASLGQRGFGLSNSHRAALVKADQNPWRR